MKKKILLSMLVVTIILSTTLINFVKAESEPFEKFTGMFIKTAEAKPGDKVYVDLYIQDTSNTSIKAYIANGNSASDKNRYITVEIQDISSNNPYFILPNDVTPGDTFEMTMIEVTDTKGTVTYSTAQGGNLPYTNSLGKKFVKVLGNNEELALKNLSIKGNSTVLVKDKLYLNLETTENVDFVTVVLKNTNSASGPLLAVQDLKENPYIVLDGASQNRPLYQGEWYISDVWLNPNKQSYVHYSKDSNDSLPLEFDARFTIVDEYENEESEVTPLQYLKLDTTTAKQNEKVYVKLSSRSEISQAMLSFIDKSSEKTMIVYLKGLTEGTPYFIVPYTTEPGTYELNYALLKGLNGSKTHYRKDAATNEIKHFDFNSTITIEKDDVTNTSLLYLENDNLTMDIINDIYEAEENITIELNAENNPIVDKSVFEAIKGKNKTIVIIFNDVEWIFNGKDIIETKSIDTSVNILKSTAEGESNIDSALPNTGIILSFAENGNLPGKCLIRVRSTEDIVNTLNSSSIKVYYYNEDENNFNKVKMHTILSDDNYYEFYINHNSKYVLTNNEIDATYVSSITSDLELNGGATETLSNTETVKSTSFISNVLNNKTLLIQLGIIIICVVLLFLLGKGIILSNKDNKKDIKDDNNKE